MTTQHPAPATTTLRLTGDRSGASHPLVDDEPTPASVWRTVSARPIADDLLTWPPDLFALTDVILDRSEAHRFAFSPPDGVSWPPERSPDWTVQVAAAARQWCAAVENETRLPKLLVDEWEIFRSRQETPLADLTHARDWRLGEALLTLHAIADEACAGLGIALTSSDGQGAVYRARAREVLARTGTLARISSHSIRVLPKVRTTGSGSSSRALSRYACAYGPGIEAHWNKVPGRRPGTDPRAQGVNFLLLPWPLRVRESDFRPVEGSVRSMEKEPFGYFEFVPSETIDLDRVDRMLVAAKDEVDRVDVVVLPESAVDETEVDGLEAVLHAHEVTGLIAGVRTRPTRSGQLPRNWVHFAQSTGEHWIHIRQHKHHRWSLDERQIYQYHLGGSLHPHVRWWEAMEIPSRSVQFIEVGEGVTVVTVVCEDLAQIDDVADLLRNVGPTMVVTPLLDGPQLSSRWAARYASVLADDPGSAVLTLTSAGMARRSRPNGHETSQVIALWKDPIRGTHEIALEADAEGVLLTASADITTRRSADGRRPIDNCTEFFDVGVNQIRAAKTGSPPSTAQRPRPTPPALEPAELTVLTSWAEAVAEVLACAPDRIEAVLADPNAGAPWRADLGLAEPSPDLSRAVDSLQRRVRAALTGTEAATLTNVLAAAHDSIPSTHELDRLARRVLRSALEQREMREARTGGGLRPQLQLQEAS